MGMAKINLVFLNITVDGGFSGVNRYLQMMMQGLAAYPDIAVHTVYVLEKKDMLFADIRYEGEEVRAIVPFPLNTRPVIKEDFWMTAYAERVADMLDGYFRGKQHLIWNVHCINLSRLAVILKQRHGGQILTYLHCIPWKFDLETNPPGFNERYRKYLAREYAGFNDSAVEQLTYEAADHLVCVTESARSYLKEFMQVAPEKISVVMNGLAPMEQSQRRQRVAGVNELLYVGRVSREKGVPGLLEALRKVKRKGYAFRLTLAGPGRAGFIRELKEKFSELELEFVGQIPFEELMSRYTACTLGVIPSLHGQCSYVALEMAMFGVPLVVTDVDGLGEMFIQRRTALKVPLVFDEVNGLSVDTRKLADAIVHLLDRPALRKQLSENVRRYFQEHFTAEIMLKNTLEIYKWMLCPK